MPEGTATHRTRTRARPVAVPGPAGPDAGGRAGQALCAGEDPELFFPSRGDPGTEARQVCSLCPSREDCLDYAVEADEFGIWGGLDQEERRKIRRHG